jgi:hypothetical protein
VRVEEIFREGATGATGASVGNVSFSNRFAMCAWMAGAYLSLE